MDIPIFFVILAFVGPMQIKGLPIILIFHDFYKNWSLRFSLGFCMKFRDSCLELQNIWPDWVYRAYFFAFFSEKGKNARSHTKIAKFFRFLKGARLCVRLMRA